MKVDIGLKETETIMRPMIAELSLLSRSDGSVSFCQGDTNVYACVHGPGEVKISKEQIDKATVEVVYKQKVGLPGCAEKLVERVIKNTCETVILTALHPRTSITVVLQEMQNCGSLLACSINAACLSLLDAAVPLKYMVAAVDCLINSDGQIILDPTDKQEKDAVAKMTFAFDSQLYQIISCETKGSFTKEQFNECLSLCKSSCSNIFQLYRDMIQQKLLKSNTK